MARPLLEPEADRTAAFQAGGSPATSILILIAAAAVAALVVSLCTSGKNAGHRNKHLRSSSCSGSSSLAPAPQEEDDNNNTGKRNNKAQLLASLSGIGVKAAAVAKMVSWNRRSPAAAAGGWSDGDGEEGEGAAGVEEDETLWKKTIILGDKCRPLEFSGHIAFDSDGNPLQPPSPPAVKEDVAPGAAQA